MADRRSHIPNEPMPAPGDAAQRATFLDAREILERVRASFREVRTALEGLTPRDERASLLVALLVRRQRELERALEASVRDVPDDVLGAQIQYAVDPGVEVPSVPPADAADAIVAWLSRHDAALERRLRDASLRIEIPAARELVEAVADLVAAHERRIARELASLRDV